MFGIRAGLRYVGTPVYFRQFQSFCLVSVPKQFHPGMICCQLRNFHHSPKLNEDSFHVVFVESDGERIVVPANDGDNILDVALENDIDIEGACEGTCCCSTCHVILSSKLYDTLEEPTEDEEDMLDLAPGVTDTSRLGCQVILTPAMNGAHFQLPDETSDLQ